MTEEITNDQNIIDSRYILNRIEYIDELLTGDDLVTGEDDLEIESITKEFEILRDLVEQCEGCGDFKHGEALIRGSYFQEYAEELAYDTGVIKHDYSWPLCHINWEEAADALKQDYMSVNFYGEDYWIRA